MSDLNGLRAHKKAQTRTRIRTIAQTLFAEYGFGEVTVADIAREAGVAVQTVFNHFATKEELFFDGRTPWLDAPARAVRQRSPGTSPLAALRTQLGLTVQERLESLALADRRSYVATLEASEALRCHERVLLQECERQLSAALVEAWNEPDTTGPADPEAVAPITAAVWMAAARVLFIDQRAAMSTDDPEEAVRAFTDRLLAQMEVGLSLLHGVLEPLPRAGAPRSETPWSHPTVRRAG